MLSAILLTLAQSAAPIPAPSIEEAQGLIAARDAQLFWAAFEGCDPSQLADVLAEDFRMIHDLGGEVATSRAQFVAEMEQQCDARKPGGRYEGYKNRRLIVPGSVTVTPLGEWGVLQRGHHTFQEWRGPDKGWEQTGGAYFINVWQWNATRGVYEMQETISVDHAAAPAYPPEASANP